MNMFLSLRVHLQCVSGSNETQKCQVMMTQRICVVGVVYRYSLIYAIVLSELNFAKGEIAFNEHILPSSLPFFFYKPTQ
jgi:hypothetical protein